MTSLITILMGDSEQICFDVPSSTEKNESHLVTWDFDNGWICTCDGCLLGGHLCKHILAAHKYMQKISMYTLDDARLVFTGSDF